MENVSNPIIVDQYYCDSPKPCKNQVSYQLLTKLCSPLGSSPPLAWLDNDFTWLQTSAVHVSKLAFVNIKGTSASEEAKKFACSDSSPCQGLYLEDTQLLTYTGVTTSYCWNAQGSSSGIVYPPPCFPTDESIIKQKTLHGPRYSSWLWNFISYDE